MSTLLARWRASVPTLVLRLSERGALVVGSQATRFAIGEMPAHDRDWDLFVPFAHWRRAAMLVPRAATLNGNRGLRVADPRVDVWPDELQRFLEEATADDGKKRPTTQHVVSLVTGLVIEARGTKTG